MPDRISSRSPSTIPRPSFAGPSRLPGTGPFSVVFAVLLALGGCSVVERGRAVQMFGAGAAFEGEAEGRQTSGKYLQASLHGVEAVARLAPSPFEERRAGAGNTLLVLDVSVLNRDSQPRVFSEGKLIAVNGDLERAFATPVDMLSDGFLSLQVLAPSAQVRGRIVYEVPRRLQGRLYWIPADGDARIALEGLDLSRPAAQAEPVKPLSRISQPASVPATASTAPATAAAATRGVPHASTPPPAERRDPAMPATPGTVWSGAGRWPPRESPSFECANAWKRVEHIICSDQTLANMDWELNRAYAIARGSVADRAALQRDENAWRFSVRDACPSRECVEAVYERRIGELYAMARQ